MNNHLLAYTTLCLIAVTTSLAFGQTNGTHLSTIGSRPPFTLVLRQPPSPDGIAWGRAARDIDGQPSTVALEAWERVDRLSSGMPLVVSLKTGEQVNGAFQATDPGTLVVVERSGGARHIPKSEVTKVVSGEKIRDPLSNGAGIGAAIGLGVALGILRGITATNKEGEYLLPSAKFFVPMLGVGGGLAVGLAIDSKRQRTETLYQAVN